MTNISPDTHSPGTREVEPSSNGPQSYGQSVKTRLLDEGLPASTDYRDFEEAAWDLVLDETSAPEDGLSVDHLKASSKIVREFIHDAAKSTDLPMSVEIASQPFVGGANKQTLDLSFAISKSYENKPEVAWIGETRESLWARDINDEKDVWKRTATFGISYLGDMDPTAWTKMSGDIGSDLAEVYKAHIMVSDAPPDLEGKVHHGSGTCGEFEWSSSAVPEVAKSGTFMSAYHPKSVRYNLSLSHKPPAVLPSFQASSCTPS